MYNSAATSNVQLDKKLLCVLTSWLDNALDKNENHTFDIALKIFIC
jgi:hypothetical protein